MSRVGKSFAWAAAPLLLLLAAAGCVDDAPDAPPAPASGPASPRPSVIALLDTGVNPYHVAFQAAPGQGAEAFAEAFGAQVVDLSDEGDFEARYEADGPLWESLEEGKLYAFAGTRVLGVSIGRDERRPPVLDFLGHGTGTASLAAREDPGALVLMVQVDARLCDPFNLECPVFMKDAEAMAWIAEQPWVDVVSVSLGYTGNPPMPDAVNPDVAPYLAASRLAHDRGKLLVAGAGNTVAPALFSHFAGPSWVVTVGGAQPATQGEELDSSKGVDVVANYTEVVAMEETIDGFEWTTGTSFGTPLVAGALSRALAHVRAQGGPAPAADLRAALNATARHFAAADWDPTAKPSNETYWNLFSPNVPVLVPAAQMGWGHVHGGMAEEIARRVLERDLAPPAEKATTAAWQARWQALREAYWAGQA